MPAKKKFATWDFEDTSSLTGVRGFHIHREHGKNVQNEVAAGAGGGISKTFVMERGKVGRVLSQLVLDLRHIMEPYTASKLKVRQRNVLKDFVAVAGPLGVTHFIIVSKTERYINLKVCCLPRGPTITFHINAFCLSREVVSNLKKPLSVPHQFLTPPMLIMNNFPSDVKPSKITSTMFQNMFPSINVQTVKLSNLKRCVLLCNNPESNTVELRHYAIRVQARGMSKGIKTLAGSHVPDLGKYQDISEYVLGGQGSDSEGEELGGEGDVILPQDLPGRGNVHSQQSVVRLSELGPRLTLQLVKVEAGLCEGKVLHHTFICKSKKEQRTLKKRIEDAKRLRAERRRQQEANVAKKCRERELHRQQCMKGVAKREDSDGVEGEESEEEDDDMEWYRQEVGQEPDPDTFISSGGSKTRPAGGLKRRKKSPHSFSAPQSKRQRLTTTDKRAGDNSKQRRGGILKTSLKAKKPTASGTRSEASSSPRKKAFSKPVVRFAEKKKRSLKGKQFKGSVGKTGGGGGVKRRSGGQVFRRRAKAS